MLDSQGSSRTPGPLGEGLVAPIPVREGIPRTAGRSPGGDEGRGGWARACCSEASGQAINFHLLVAIRKGTGFRPANGTVRRSGLDVIVIIFSLFTLF